MKPHHIIWILGGMWPYASLRCLQLLLDESKKYSAGSANNDFPHILLDSIPVSDLTEATDSLAETVGSVRTEYLKLTKMGASIILMACNTMHLYTHMIYRDHPNVHHLSLIDEAIQDVVSRGHRNIGILGSMNTIESRLYQSALEQLWVSGVVINDREILKSINEIIQKNIAWDTHLHDGDRAILKSSIALLEEQWATCIILGCTELPIAFAKIESALELFDPLTITIRSACQIYYGG